MEVLEIDEQTEAERPLTDQSNLHDIASWCAGRRIFVTGHTGFKGSWLCQLLHSFGAEVHGFSLDPPTVPSMYEVCRVQELVRSTRGDVRDLEDLASALEQARPAVVLHLAAQPLVRDSYKNPVETYATNVMGTVHLLEAVRHVRTIRAVVVVTSDKCYENREQLWGYREDEPLGGHDPYSSSKACAEIATSSYRRSFFDRASVHCGAANGDGPAGIATVRAGNVIGGGDWARDRLVPDCVRAATSRSAVVVRSPSAIRPWQHVLDPLVGYLELARRLYQTAEEFSGPWNFGPGDDDVLPVSWIVQRLSEGLGSLEWECTVEPQAHESHVLRLDSSKARTYLGWKPRWRLPAAMTKVVEWYQAWMHGADMRAVTLAQINSYLEQQ